jgi:glycosyltransferase involved in cell wall biosynthesis
MRNTATADTPLVALQQVCIPHYRQRLLDKLGADPRFRLLVLADPDADVPFLPMSGAPDQCEFEPAARHAVKLPFGCALSWQPAAVKAVLRYRPDVVIAQGSPYELTAWILTVVGRIFRIPVLLWTHGLQGEESGVKWLIRSCLFRLSRGLLIYGDHAKRLLMAKGFAADRIHVIYNSLDDCEQAAVSEQITPDDCEAFRRSLGIKAQERLICFTGRLQPVKRLPWLLRALHLVVRRGRNVHLVLVGDGSERPLLESLAQELKLTKFVHFLGAIYDESRLGLVLSASDLAVVPSGAGLSVMHALGYGTPVLLHDRVEEHFPEWEAVKEAETGWFYRYDDLSDCTEKIINALFPIPRKPAMASACRSVINSRYNTGTHAGLIIDAVAKHCAFATLVEKDRRRADGGVPCGSLERSVKEG